MSPVAKPMTVEERYERIFGKPPHHRMKPETIRRKVEEHVEYGPDCCTAAYESSDQDATAVRGQF